MHLKIFYIFFLLLTVATSPATASNKESVADTSSCLKLKEEGNNFVVKNQYVEALKCYTSAMEIAQKSNNQKVYTECISNIGMVYAAFRDYDRAIFYFKKANTEAQHDNHHRLVSLTAINLVAAYCAKGDHKHAEQYQQQLIDHPLSTSQQQQYYITFNQGLIAGCKKEYRLAIDQLHKAAIMSGKECSPSIWYELGNAYSGKGDIDSAVVCYQKAINIAKNDNNFEETTQACKALSDIFKQLSKPDSAVKYQTFYINLQDSLFNINKFNLAKAELIDYENDIINKHINALHGWIGILVMVVLIILAVLFVILRLYKQLQSTQRLLVRKNEELIAQSERNKLIRADYLSSLKEKTPILPPQDDDLGDIDNSNDNTTIKANELPLTPEQKLMLMEQISQVMDNSDIIIDQDFSLNKLAKLVNSNSKYVSAIINDSFQKNFKTLLNESRIREVCRRLSDTENYGKLTIAAIASSVGYNSMNNFISVFKRIMGMTPSKYRQLSLKERNKE